MSDSSSANTEMEPSVQGVYQFKKFEKWIDEPLNRWEPQKLRASFIKNIADVLYDWIDFKDYKLNCDKDAFVNKLATFAYYIDSQMFYDPNVTLLFGKPKHRNLANDWDEYCYAFDTDFWYDIKNMFEPSYDTFLFYSERASEYFWSSISEYIYKLLDIANSPYVQAYDARDKKIEEDYVNAMIEDGLLFIDKKGRVVAVNKNDPYKEYDEYSNRY